MMNSWSEVIIEWANCLGVVESSVESIQDFQDGVFFETLVSQLCRGNEESFNDLAIELDEDFVSKYLRAEYPRVKDVDNEENGRRDLYTATLLLVQCAQQPMFHRPMCVALKQETQVRIKRFLEVVLPCGKNLTRESIESAINGLQAEASPGQTRLTPRGLPLREFFNSPAVKSARSQRFMNERNRELLCLRAQLETEQYEKADLIEDLKMQSEKVSNLQKKLEEKEKELRDLRIDRSKPPTPQSCRKSKCNNSNEERFRRLAEELEICNSQLVLELERTRGEREELALRLSSNEKTGEIMRDKLKQAEKTLETLTHELDTKNNEIAYLRVNTEELREHIRQTKRLSFGEQSFDAEPACDEALSSIVDLQLQEARKETCQLQKELAQVRLELENSVRECQKLPQLEIALRDTTEQLDSLRKSLEHTENQLLARDSQVVELERERSELSEKVTNLRDSLQEKIQLLALNESDLQVARTKIHDLTDSLKTAQSETIELNSVVQGARQELEKTQSLVASQEENLSFLTKEKNRLESLLSETRNELRGISISLENEKVCVKKLESIVKSCNEQSAALRKDLSLSNERLLLVNGERKILETTLRSTVEKLETTEICLQKEKTRSADLETIVSAANRDIEALKISLESQAESLNNESRKVTDLESVVERRKQENQDLQSVLDGLEATMQTERAEANALRQMFAGSKKSCEDLESLLKSKETLLEGAKERENSLNEELESCRAKIDELSDSLGTEVAKCREFETKLLHKNDEYAELEKNLISSQSLLEKTESDKRQISMELIAANETIKQMESKLVDAKSEISSLEEQQKRNISANDALQEYAKVAADKMAHMESKIFNCEALIEQLNRSLTEKTEKVNELQNELNEKSTCLDSLELQLDESAKRETATANELRTLERKLAELTELRQEMESQIAQERERSSDLRDEIETLEEKLSVSVDKNKHFHSRVEKLTEQFNETRDKLHKEIAVGESLNETLQQLRAKNSELGDDVTAKENQVKSLRSQWEDCKKELASRVNEISIFQQNIDSVMRELEECQENFHKVSLKNEQANKELESTRAINRELEENLASKKQEIETVLSDWNECKKELASYVSKVSALELDIEKISNELAESQENYRKQSQETEQVRKELNAARATNQDLEEKCKNRKIEVEALTIQRNNLEHDLAKSATENSTIKMEIEKMRHELENYALEIEKQTAENAMLNEKELELKKSMEILKLQLAEETERLKTLESEKVLLESELSSCALLKIETSEEIKALQKAVEKSRRDEEISREKQSEERAKLEQRIAELSEESKLHLEEIDSSRNELENIKLERERLREKMQDTSNAVTVLEKRLVVAENLRMEVELEDKLKKEALNVVQAKLEQLGKEKIESELRMKEVIANLQEVRTSQDQVMEAQIQALEEKSRQQESLEQELAELRVLFEEKSKRLASEESRVKEVLSELQKLEEKMEEKSELVEKLESSLESERRSVSETEQSLESLREKMREIARVTQDLKLELNCLWDSVRETCPELARSKHVAEDDAERLLEAFVEDTKAVRKVVSILSEANETLKEHASSEKESAKITWEEAKKGKLELEERLKRVEKELETRQQEISLLDKRNEELREFLQKVASEKNKVEDELVHLMNRWSLLNIEADNFVSSAILDCEELKNLVSQRNAIENSLINFNERQVSNSKSLIQALDRIFSPVAVEEKSLPGAIVSEEIQRDELMKQDLASLAKKMNEFSESLKTYDTKLKSGLLRDAAESEKKLRAELERISKEKKEIREKLDTARARSARMEKNMDELRNDSKKVKSELTEELEKLRAAIEKLEQEKTDLSKRINEKADVETLHKEYGQKLEKIKQKMKTAYNEQIAKLNQEQEKILKGKMESLKIQTEQQCRKYAEDIAKYKAHISDLSSRYWDVGEKLLAESQEKQVALQEVQKLKELRQHHDANAEIREQVVHSRQKTASLDRREFTIDRLAREPAARTGYGAVEVIEEETTTYSTHRRHSVKSIQAMGNAFKAEDEEGEVFDSVYLADLKEGRCAPTGPDLDRLSELRMRNSMCRPHLKSSYAVETHLQPIALHEDDIKNGVTGDDVFNDSLSQSLLPGQKPKKKDRTQTSYKRPGPPTPSKNGGRLSLQGNELKSPNSRILKERNVERRTTATPRGLKNLFGTSMSRRQDENTVGTPKGRRLSNIFRKQRTERN